MNKIEYTLSKEERIYAQKRIDSLFAGSDSFIAYPLRIVYTMREPEEGQPPVAILVSVSKKRFKRANKRNRVKRLVREAFRLNKQAFVEITLSTRKSFDIAFLYLKDELPDYAAIEKAMLKTVAVLNERLVTGTGNENNS